MSLTENLGDEFHLTFLADHAQFLPTIAKWAFDEWGHQSPESSLESMTAELQSWLNKTSAPAALVGLLKGNPIASSIIKIRELEPFPQYTHWLGGVYVKLDYRKQGVGSLVVEHSTRIARDMGISELYLYTHSHEDFYTNLGFTPIDRPSYRGRKIVIMRRMLGSNKVSQG
jgi:putative hydrolase of the HAD superfamily